MIEFSRKITPITLIWRGKDIGTLKNGKHLGTITRYKDNHSAYKPTWYIIDTPEWEWGWRHPMKKRDEVKSDAASSWERKLGDAKYKVANAFDLIGRFDEAVESIRSVVNGQRLSLRWIVIERAGNSVVINPKGHITPAHAAWHLINTCAFIEPVIPEDIQLLAVTHNRLNKDMKPVITSEKALTLHKMYWEL